MGEEESREVLWLNGDLVPASQARISPFDHGFTVGDGVFETLVALHGQPFAFAAHWERLEKGADRMGLKPPPPQLVLNAIRQVMEATGRGGDEKSRIRITMTGGPAAPGSSRGSVGETVVVAVTDVPEYAPATRVITVPFLRNERGAVAGIKTTSYAENVVALAAAQQAGASEALMANTRGHLCEGTGSNVFLVDEGDKLATPSLSSGCLDGVTRKLVLTLCQDLEIACEERVIEMPELERSSEVFLTSTTRGVQAIEELDGRLLLRVMGRRTSLLKKELKSLEVRAASGPDGSAG